MMPYMYTAIDGTTVHFDLDDVIDVAIGFSRKRPQWTSTLIFVLATGAFVELRSSPQDFRGNSQEEAEEASPQYLFATYRLTEENLKYIQKHPNKWTFMDMRTKA